MEDFCHHRRLSKGRGDGHIDYISVIFTLAFHLRKNCHIFSSVFRRKYIRILQTEASIIAVILIRTIIVFICLLVSMRLLGKRQLSELEISELIVAVLISDIASLPLQDASMPLINALFPIFALLSCELLISGITLKSVKLRGIIFGKPSILIRNGVIDQQSMRKNRFSLDELAESLRSNNVTDITKVRYAILETDGAVNVILNSEAQALTEESITDPQPDSGMPHIIINDGQILDDNLRLMGRDMRWLNAELKKRKVSRANQVYLMSLDDGGNIYFTKKER